MTRVHLLAATGYGYEIGLKDRLPAYGAVGLNSLLPRTRDTEHGGPITSQHRLVCLAPDSGSGGGYAAEALTLPPDE